MRIETTANTGQLISRSLFVAVLVTVGDIVVELVGDIILGGSHSGIFGGDAIIQGLIGRYLGALALTVILGYTSQRLPWSLGERVFILSFAVFAISNFNTYLELYFFSNYPARLLIMALLVGLPRAALSCFVVSYLFPPAGINSTLKADLRVFFLGRGLLSWVLRLSFADLIYVITYFIFGAIAFHYTRPYYTDPAYGLNLKLPEVGLVLKLQFLRSFIYLAVCLPLIAGLRLKKLQSAVLIGLLLFMGGGLTPLLSNQVWPLALRFYHMVEIFFQNFTTGFILVWLLYLNEKKKGMNEIRMGQTDFVSRSI